MNAVFGCYKTRRYTATRESCFAIRPGGGRRNQIAIRNASQTSVAFIRKLSADQIIRAIATALFIVIVRTATDIQ